MSLSIILTELVYNYNASNRSKNIIMVMCISMSTSIDV